MSTRKRVAIFATKRQAQAIRHLTDMLERIAPYGINERSFMWPEISIVQRLAYNIERATSEQEAA